MDWALKAVKKRMKSRKGDSRSIIESLNKLNDFVLTGHAEVNKLLQDTNGWLDLEMKRVGFKEEAIIESIECSSFLDSRSKHEAGDQKSLDDIGIIDGGNFDVSLEPSELQCSKHVNENVDDRIGFIDDSNSEETSAINVGPSSKLHESNEQLVKQVTRSTSVAVSSSPCSSHKVDRALKEDAYGQVQQNATITNEIDQGVNRSLTEAKHSSSKSTETTASFKFITAVPPSRDRTLRRSNMFVPLPNKDPLIVQPASSKAKMIKNMAPVVNNFNSSADLSMSSLGTEALIPTGARSYGSTKGHSGSIFERLSSISTKSFEKKIAIRSTTSAVAFKSPVRTSRSPARFCSPACSRYPRLSQANTNGSPICRRSTVLGSYDQSNEKMRETLKSIFDSKIPTLNNSASEKCIYSIDKGNHTKTRAINQDSNLSTTQRQRRSLIPRIDKFTLTSKNIQGIEKKSRSITPIKRSDASLKIKKLNRNCSPKSEAPYQKSQSASVLLSHQTPSKLSYKQHSNQVISESLNTKEEPDISSVQNLTVFTPSARAPGLIGTKLASSKTPARSGALISKAKKDSSSPTEKTDLSKTLISVIGSAILNTSSESKEISNKQRRLNDRLTKFQLLPQAGSEKHDLKRKLDKRLSEVMRNQQEQQLLRHRQEQKLKRKSQLEDENNRRTKILSEFLDNPIVARPKTNVNTYLSKLPNQSVLFDLYATDHRSDFGGTTEYIKDNATLKSCVQTGESTLPHIDSDSESDSDSHRVLAVWAKSPHLETQLLAQEGLDAEKIFGPIPPLHVNEIFQNSRFSKLKSRQSVSRPSASHSNFELK